MSHVTTISIEIRSLAALKAAVKEMGCEFVEGQRTYKWFGQSVGDYPLPKGMTKDMLGKCDHAIRVPGVNYEVGVVKLPNGNYTLAYDFYGDGSWGGHDGKKLEQKFGAGCQKLVQLYAVQAATMAARAQGYMVHRLTAKNGNIQLRIGA